MTLHMVLVIAMKHMRSILNRDRLIAHEQVKYIFQFTQHRGIMLIPL